MKIHRNTKLFLSMAMAGTGLAAAGTLSAQPSSPPAGNSPGHDHRHQMGQNMMPMCSQMQAENTAADARLDKLTAAMNAAKGDKKVPAMAAVLNELVAEHKAMGKQMHAGMSSMNSGKMGGMPGHGGMQGHDSTPSTGGAPGPGAPKPGPEGHVGPDDHEGHH